MLRQRLTVDDVLELLRRCMDPEVGLSIVDLGFVRSVDVQRDTVIVKITLGSRDCPLHFAIAHRVHALLSGMSGVERVEVELVWDPPWTPKMMSPEAKNALFY
ncbi:MAG: metal-sulfur cluster assembly factor [Candidatus Thermoplasmatota archaeon]